MGHPHPPIHGKSHSRGVANSNYAQQYYDKQIKHDGQRRFASIPDTARDWVSRAPSFNSQADNTCATTTQANQVLSVAPRGNATLSPPSSTPLLP